MLKYSTIVVVSGVILYLHSVKILYNIWALLIILNGILIKIYFIFQIKGNHQKIIKKITAATSIQVQKNKYSF